MNWHVPSHDDWNKLVDYIGNFPSKTLQRAGNRCTGVACYHLGDAGLDGQLLGYISEYDNTTTKVPPLSHVGIPGVGVPRVTSAPIPALCLSIRSS